MSAEAFDKKFGAQLVSSAPTTPGVYRYLAKDAGVLYVGKAKNLRRRLANYRNATPKKAHRKLRTLVREAHALTYEVCESEEAALLYEGELIRALRPPYNVDGAYAFLYPALGLGAWDKHTLLCFTTEPSVYEPLDLTWFGTFRSRPRVKLAFEALVDLLSMVGHLEKATRLPSHVRLRGSRLVGVRQMPLELVETLPAFLDGADRVFLSLLARRLLDKPQALRSPREVQSQLGLLRTFHEADAVRLRAALASVGKAGTYVCQDERDALFILAKGRARAE